MTKPYNASLYTMIEYVKEKFTKVTKTFNNEKHLFEKNKLSTSTARAVNRKK